MYKKHAFSREKISINTYLFKSFAMTKKQKVFMVVSSIFSLSSLSNLLKYENVRSLNAEDEGRKKLVKK